MQYSRSPYLLRGQQRRLAANLYRHLGGSKATLLPVPFMNILNGGVHANNSIDFQEFLIVRVAHPASARRFASEWKFFILSNAFFKQRGIQLLWVMKGGLHPPSDRNEEAVELILEGIVQSKFKLGVDVSLAIDPAASEFVDKTNREYVFEKSDRSRHSRDDMVKLWASWIRQYPIISLEDGMAETDWDGWKDLTQELGGNSTAHR